MSFDIIIDGFNFCERFNFCKIVQEGQILKKSLQRNLPCATPFKMHTPSVEDVGKVFHSGSVQAQNEQLNFNAIHLLCKISINAATGCRGYKRKCHQKEVS